VDKIKYLKSTDIDYLSSFLAVQIASKLADGKVLWLLPGGSAIELAVAVGKRLGPQPNLTITLTDERYGPVDHPDSNWYRLMAAGFIVPQAKLLPVLSDVNLAQTVKNYNQLLSGGLAMNDYSLALTGMGPDGHIFGIKPHSPAVSSNQAVVGFAWDDYIRLTPTAKMLGKLDEIMVYAMGHSKHAQFDKLELYLPVDEQPAQLLKQLNKVTIFNDYKGVSL